MELEYTVKRLKSKDIKGENRLNAQYVVMLLRIADYLDIDEKEPLWKCINLLLLLGMVTMSGSNIILSLIRIKLKAVWQIGRK